MLQNPAKMAGFCLGREGDLSIYSYVLGTITRISEVIGIA